MKIQILVSANFVRSSTCCLQQTYNCPAQLYLTITKDQSILRFARLFPVRLSQDAQVFRFATSPRSLIVIRLRTCRPSVCKKCVDTFFIVNDCAFSCFSEPQTICSSAVARLFNCAISISFWCEGLDNSSRLSAILRTNSSKSANLLSSSSTCMLTLVKYSSHFSGDVERSRKFTMV